MTKNNLSIRPRRNRSSEAIRNLVQETSLTPNNFILPIFLQEGENKTSAINALPGQNRYSIDKALEVCAQAVKVGIPSVLLFAAVPENKKKTTAIEALNPEGLLPQGIKQIKNKFPKLCVMSDVALDPYSSDGHDGIVREGKIINDESVEVLKKMAVVHAKAGADVIAPSDMMDGRIAAIRKHLDDNDFEETSLLAYTAKYCSSFYGPFREALESAPKKGDKKTYQMDPANSREALRELELDLAEGADMVMVKPALSYLDIISSFKQHSTVPVVAYNVSGEYAMVKAAGKLGFADEKALMHEVLTSIKRAGADIIISYHALEYFK